MGDLWSDAEDANYLHPATSELPTTSDDHPRILRPQPALRVCAGEANPLLPDIMSSSKFRKPPLGLDHFLQRQRVLSLWREMVRAIYKIPPSNTRDEMRQYARQGFQRNRNVSDLSQIRYLISTGKTEFEGMQRYIDELAAK